METTNEWEKMLERLGQDAMSPKEITEFDKSRQEFRENFIMRDVDVMDDIIIGDLYVGNNHY